MKREVEMTRKQQTKNKLADSDGGLRHRHHLYTRYPIVARALGLAAVRPSARASKVILHTTQSLFIKFTNSKMCIVFVCVRFVKIFGYHNNQSDLLKIEILILLRLARFQN